MSSTSIHRQSESQYFPVGLHHPSVGDRSNQPSPTMSSYPPQPPLNRVETSGSRAPLSLDGRSGDRPGFPSSPRYDAAERAENISGMPLPRKPDNHRTSSWDLLKKFEHGYEEFDSRNASQAHLAFADGDIPKNKVCHKLDSLLLYMYSHTCF